MLSVHMSDAWTSCEPPVRGGRIFDLKKVDRATLDVLAKVKTLGRYVQHFLKGMPRAYQDAYGKELILMIVRMKELIYRSCFVKYDSEERANIMREVDNVFFNFKTTVDDAEDNEVCQQSRYDSIVPLIAITGKAIGGWLRTARR